MNIQDVGKNLKELRTNKGYTQSELAVVLNVSHQAVSRWEKGDNLPDVMKLSELAKLYNVTIEDLLLEERRVVEKQQSRVLSTLTIASSIISALTVILYLSLLDSGIQGWLNILILYILIIGNSLLYALPFGIKKEPITLKDVNYLMIGISSTLFAVGMTIISTIEGGIWFQLDYLLNGMLIAFILVLVNISVFSVVKNKLFGSRLNLVTRSLLKTHKKTWRRIVIVLAISTFILLPPVLYSGDFAFLTVIVGALAVIVLLILLVTKFNLITLMMSILYSFVYGFLLFYIYNTGEMTHEMWDKGVNTSSYYEDTIGIVAAIVIVLLIVLHWLYENYLSNHRKEIYLSTTAFFLQVFSIVLSGPVFRNTRQTSNGSLVFVGYNLDFDIKYSIVFQIIILSISLLIFTELFTTIRNRSLNKGK